MKIQILTASFFLVSVQPVFNQAPSILWESTFGGSEYDDGRIICKSMDGGYLLVGNTYSDDGDVTFNHGFSDYWVMKIDEFGNDIWQKSYGGTGWEEAFDAISTLDGGYIIAGHTQSNDGDVTFNHGDDDCWVIKINATGDLEWEKTYGGSNTEYVQSILQTLDEGYIFTGFSYSNDGDISAHHGISENSDMWVVKLDAVGEIIWEKSLGGSSDELGNGIYETSDSGFILTGYAESVDGDLIENAGGFDLWNVKLNSEGEIEWQHTFGGTDYDYGFDILQVNDSLFITLGMTYSNDGDVTGKHAGLGADIWILMTNTSNEIIWADCYGGTGAELGFSIKKLSNGSYLIAGITTSLDDGDVVGHHGGVGYADYWLLNIDSVGVIKWQKCLGGSLGEESQSILEEDDGSLFVAGYAFSTDGDVSEHHGIESNRDYWVVRLEKPCEQMALYRDYDEDTFGDQSNYIYSCLDSLGYVLNDFDCYDSSTIIFPGAIDICNHVDDNCNGLVDEDAKVSLWFEDLDGDEFGNIEVDSLACDVPIGFVPVDGDCNDTNELIYPGAPELLNGMDDDCDQLTDEGLDIDDHLTSTIFIYPNPVLEVLHISFTNNLVYQLHIFNSIGQIIYADEIIDRYVEVDAIQFSAGVYVIEIRSDEGIQYLPFIKQ